MQTLTRWSITHRRRVVAIWLVLLAVSIATAGAVRNRFDQNLTLPGTGAQRAADLLASRFPARAGDTDQIVFHTAAGSLAAPSTRARVEATLAAVARLPHVVSVAGPYATLHAVSRDGATGFATVTFNERADALPAVAVTRVIDTARSGAGHGLAVALAGGAIEESERPTLGAATAIGILAALVVLSLSFGSPLAAGLPVLTALFGIGTSMGAIAALTHLISTPDFASELALLIGLGVGIDYALFVVTRFRDAHQANGGNVAAAVELAMSTAGRSIAFAGATVVIAMMGLFVVGVRIFDGVALAVSITVALVLAASLTLLPATLSLVGRRVGGRRPRRRRTGGPGRWHAWIEAVLRRPVRSAAAATALLVVLAAPALGLRLAASDAGTDPSSTTTRQAYDLLSRGFGPGFNGPLQLAVQLPRAGDRPALDRLARAVAGTPGVAAVSRPVLSRAGTTAALTVYPAASPASARTYALVSHLRSAVIPPVARATGATVDVGGYTASQVDFAHVIAGRLPAFIGVVIALSALLLLVVFRSLAIPLQAAVMNLLSIGAALGIAQAVFERGWLAGPLGVTRSPVEAYIPVIVFAIVFGLSMDYEVFLVSRIREEWSRGLGHREAIHEGVIRTGRVITAAAAVMVVVFASFAAADNHVLKLFGLTLAVAVLLDAVVIRSILLPAVLALLGRATWRFPAWADRRLPRVTIEAPEPTPETPTALEVV
jgi:putative drug exporter of the RND superfamily